MAPTVLLTISHYDGRTSPHLFRRVLLIHQGRLFMTRQPDGTHERLAPIAKCVLSCASSTAAPLPLCTLNSQESQAAAARCARSTHATVGRLLADFDVLDLE